MEQLFRSFKTAAQKIADATRDLLEQQEATTQEKMKAVQRVNDVKTKQDALDLIVEAKTGVHTDLNNLGYYRALREMAVGRARVLGASEAEIDDAIGKGVDKGSSASILGKRV